MSPRPPNAIDHVAPLEARWVRSEPRRAIPAAEAERMVRRAFPRGRIVRAQPLAGGFRNANVKVTLDATAEPIVLRVYEHDASLCRKEADLIRVVGGSVPVPEVILAEPAGEGLRPFMLQRFVEGPTLRELVGSARSEEVAEAAHSAGETLAAIGSITFAKPGWLAPGPTVTHPLLPGADPMPRFVDRFLASPMLQRRVPAELRDADARRAARSGCRRAGGADPRHRGRSASCSSSSVTPGVAPAETAARVWRKVGLPLRIPGQKPNETATPRRLGISRGATRQVRRGVSGQRASV